MGPVACMSCYGRGSIPARRMSDRGGAGAGRTMTRDAQSASRPACAHGGAINVPSDHSATPASSTRAPPILSQHVSFSPAPYCDARQHNAYTPIPQTNVDRAQFAGIQTCRSMCQNSAREVRTSLIPSQQGFAWQNTCAASSFGLSTDVVFPCLCLHAVSFQTTRNCMPMRWLCQAHPQKNAEDTRPRSVALQPSSLAMGMTATLMFTLRVPPPRVSASSRRDESEPQCMSAMPLGTSP